MSSGSIISLIIFLGLVAFAITGQIVALPVSSGIMLALWFWRTRTKPNQHFQNLATANENHEDANFLTDTKMPALLPFLQNQMPRAARHIPLHLENTLFTDLQIDPVKFELDEMPKFCKSQSLQYEIDPENPLWTRMTTIQDLVTYIATLKPTR